jgi:pilus assembly protein Flp/PilA
MIEKFISLMLVGRDEEKGATATEYGLLVGLIALIIVVGVGAFGGNLNAFFSGLASTVGGWN